MTTAQRPDTDKTQDDTRVNARGFSGVIARGPLYMIAADLRMLLDDIAAAEGEVTPEQEEALSLLNVSLDEKVEACALLLHEYEADDAVLAAEVKRLSERRAVVGREVARLKAYVLKCMLDAKVSKVKGKLAGARWQLNPAKVDVDLSRAGADEASLRANVPATLLREVPEQVIPASVEVDKAAVKAAWETGENLPDGITVTRTARLVVL